MDTHPSLALQPGQLRRVHHLALNVKDMTASRQFYGGLLGLRELTGDEVDDTLKDLVATGKVTNFLLPDGLILDLFSAPNLDPPDPESTSLLGSAASGWFGRWRY
jgi:glyoxylase I family protein